MLASAMKSSSNIRSRAFSAALNALNVYEPDPLPVTASSTNSASCMTSHVLYQPASSSMTSLSAALAKEARAAEREVVPEEEEDKGKAALTELFNGVKNRERPIIVQNVVNDIDEIVKVTRFEGWQATTAGVKEIKKQLRTILWMRYKLKDQDLFDKAYAYVEMYY